MIGNKTVTALVLVGLMMGLGACAETRLADDPTTEPVSQTALDNEQFNDEAPDQEATESQTLPEPQTIHEPTYSVELSMDAEAMVLAKYSYLDPNRLVPTNLLRKAVLYFDANSSKFANKRVISVIDFSARSTKARFFVIDLATGSVWAMHVAHGKNSDLNHDGYADSFSNASGSNQSSLGFYKAAETYYGAHGLSLKLDGLSSTNSRARARAVVIHGASYVQDTSVIQGRSWGCPAISMKNRDVLVSRLKGGSLIYAGLSAKE